MLVVNNNLGHVVHRFLDIAMQTSEIDVITPPQCQLKARLGPISRELPYKIQCSNTIPRATPDSENCMLLRSAVSILLVQRHQNRWFHTFNVPSGVTPANFCTVSQYTAKSTDPDPEFSFPAGSISLSSFTSMQRAVENAKVVHYGRSIGENGYQSKADMRFPFL